MNKALFESGAVELPPKKTLIRILLQARKEIGKSEDDWTLDEMIQVRSMLPKEYQSIDPSIIGVRMRRLRKDKDVPKIKPPKTYTDRFEKLLRDYKKRRDRRQVQHSKEYDDYIHSDVWRSVSREHKDRCNWRCQLCNRQTSKLETHHTAEGYKNLGKEKPWHLLAVCSDPCHPIADMLREGLTLRKEDLGFFSEDEIP